MDETNKLLERLAIAIEEQAKATQQAVAMMGMLIESMSVQDEDEEQPPTHL